jgi:hypothetical protein
MLPKGYLQFRRLEWDTFTVARLAAITIISSFSLPVLKPNGVTTLEA